MAWLDLLRRTVKDFVYEGKLVPAGSISFLTVWACNHGMSRSNLHLTHVPHAVLIILQIPKHGMTPKNSVLSDGLKKTPIFSIFSLDSGSCICISNMLAYQELYLIFPRLLDSFEMIADGKLNADPLTGQEDPVALTTQPKASKVRFLALDSVALESALELVHDLSWLNACM